MSRIDRSDYLFRQYDLRSTLENQDGELEKAIDAYPAEALLVESEEELTATFTERFRIDPPALTEGAMSVTAEETEIDVSGDRNRDIWNRDRPFYVQGIEVTYYVPFTGDPNLFKFQAATRSFNPPRAEIVGHELRFSYGRADSDVGQTKVEFERDLSNVRQHLSWIGNDTSMYNATLPAKTRAKVAERRARLEKKNTGMQALGIPIRQAGHSTSPPRPPTRHAAPTFKKPERTSYDVALSFAGENRDYVEKVAELLRKSGVSVFYDGFEQAKLWGKNLIDHLAEVYRDGSKFVVMFVSEHYVKKAFPTHERQHAQARALLAKEEYILPARFDDTEVPGMTSTVAYVDLRELSPEQLTELILAKIA